MSKRHQDWKGQNLQDILYTPGPNTREVATLEAFDMFNRLQTLATAYLAPIPQTLRLESLLQLSTALEGMSVSSLSFSQADSRL